MSDGISDMYIQEQYEKENVCDTTKSVERPTPITGIWVSNNRRRMRKKIVEIIGAGIEKERAECKADIIIGLYNQIIIDAIKNNKHCTPFCDGWHEYLKLIIK